jgi:hypothetical protein
MTELGSAFGVIIHKMIIRSQLKTKNHCRSTRYQRARLKIISRKSRGMSCQTIDLLHTLMSDSDEGQNKQSRKKTTQNSRIQWLSRIPIKHLNRKSSHRTIENKVNKGIDLSRLLSRFLTERLGPGVMVDVFLVVLHAIQDNG